MYVVYPDEVSVDQGPLLHGRLFFFTFKKAWPNKASPTPSPGDVDSRCAAAAGARHKAPSELIGANAKVLLANQTNDDRCAFKKETAREIENSLI
jgi:hypothetical protein